MDTVRYKINSTTSDHKRATVDEGDSDHHLPIVLNLSDLILRLKNFRRSKQQRLPLIEEEVGKLCSLARDMFLDEPMLLEVTAPIRVVGDIHGQYHDLLKILDHCGYPRRLATSF